MGYVGNWNNLRDNLDHVRRNIERSKTRASSLQQNSSKPNPASANRKTLSLVEMRRNDLRKIRLVYILLVLAGIVSLYFFL